MAFGMSPFPLQFGSRGGALPPIVNTVLPAISGTVSIGQTLTCSTGTWASIGSVSYAYQWQRGGVNIAGATDSTYTLVTGDGGYIITCEVTATAVNGEATAETDPTVVVPTILWSDDFSAYADTSEMLAGGWQDGSTGSAAIALNAARLQLIADGNDAIAYRSITGYVIGDRIRVTYTLSGDANHTDVTLRETVGSGALASGGATRATHAIDYTTTTASMVLLLRRSTTAEFNVFSDNIRVENLDP